MAALGGGAVAELDRRKEIAPTATSDKYLYLEGLRGLACLVVVYHHYCCAFWPFFVGTGADNVAKGNLDVAKGPLRLWFSGRFAVCIFFVLSGFVLSAKFVKTGSVSALVSTAVRRFLRLFFPVIISSFIFYCMFLVGAFRRDDRAAALSGSGWLLILPNRIPLDDFLREVLLLVWIRPSFTINNVLWTMAYELSGSFAVFLLALLARYVYRGQLLVWLTIIYCWLPPVLKYNVAILFPACFFFGLAMCQRYLTPVSRSTPLSVKARPRLHGDELAPIELSVTKDSSGEVTSALVPLHCQASHDGPGIENQRSSNARGATTAVFVAVERADDPKSIEIASDEQTKCTTDGVSLDSDVPAPVTSKWTRVRQLWQRYDTSNRLWSCLLFVTLVAAYDFGCVPAVGNALYFVPWWRGHFDVVADYIGVPRNSGGDLVNIASWIYSTLAAYLFFWLLMVYKPAQRLFGSAPFAYIGKISFSLYLVHTPLILTFGCFMVSELVDVHGLSYTAAVNVTMIPYVVLCWLSSHLLWRFVDLNSIGWSAVIISWMFPVKERSR
jgi:peptidoglycan/LPS O-acetylase OafA/YrhL